MKKKKRGKKKMMLTIIGVLFIVAGITIILFSRAEKKAEERFAHYAEKAKTIETSYGKITYIDEGKGPVVLSCHGLCGGYDQAYDTLADKVDQCRVLAPSRFGYPGSDMPEDSSLLAQTNAFVELLDELGINQAYVLGTSAGGAVAIRFALEHPERTKGLILYCSGYPGMGEPAKKLTYVGPPAMLCNDFPMWFFSPLFGPIMGMDRDTIATIMPLKDRQKGIVNDAEIANTDMVNNWKNYDLTELTVLALMFHAKDDKLADYNMAKAWSEKIPNCDVHLFESGGHLMEGNSDEINAAMDEFLQP